MFCTECGKSIPEDSSYCRFCGAKQQPTEKRSGDLDAAGLRNGKSK
ncbi:zinc-ribbon domain-containing protein [Sphingomonas vulcanisoli]